MVEVAMKMIEYPKIKTLFKRDEKTFKVIPPELTMQEFGLVKGWRVAEKIHGQNVRVGWDGKEVMYGSRSVVGKGADVLHKELSAWLDVIFTPGNMKTAFGDTPVILFGEGYGAGINKGQDLCQQKRFALFDVFINEYWLSIEDVKGIAEKFAIEEAPWIDGGMTWSINDIHEHVKAGITSKIAERFTGKHVIAEGIVARPQVELRNRYGERLMFKLKTNDFAKQ